MGLAINHLSERAELSAQLTSGLSNFDDASSFLCFLYHMVCASFLKQKCVCVCVRVFCFGFKPWSDHASCCFCLYWSTQLPTFIESSAPPTNCTASSLSAGCAWS